MQIMTLEGDGIGPEIMKSATDIISVLRENFNLNIEPEHYNIGARSLDRGEWNLDRIIEQAREYKAILKAPMGDPSLVGESGTEMALDIILGLRFHFDLFANVRPVRLLPGVNSVLK